jgi:hypothetical protein
MSKTKKLRHKYHGSVGKYATLENLMKGQKNILIKKGEHGYYDIYQLPQSKKRYLK